MLPRCVFVNRYEIKFEKDDYVLRVKKASVTDEGTFTCVTENRVGKLEASATLTVRGTGTHWFWVFFTLSFGWHLHKERPSLGRFTDSLWISLIIYVTKSAVNTLCPASPVPCLLLWWWSASHTMPSLLLTTQPARPFHRLLVHTSSPIPGVYKVNKKHSTHNFPRLSPLFIPLNQCVYGLCGAIKVEQGRNQHIIFL